LKTLAIKVGEEVVSFSFRRFSKRVVEEEVARINHKVALIKRKKDQLDVRSQAFQREIDSLNKQLLALTSESVKALLEEELREEEKRKIEKHLAYLNAEQIMKEFFSPAAYEQFMMEGEHVFLANDGHAYKIIRTGTVFREETKDGTQTWIPVCLIRPRELPLPDFIVAAITSVKNQPQAYQPQMRR